MAMRGPGGRFVKKAEVVEQSEVVQQSTQPTKEGNTMPVFGEVEKGVPIPVDKGGGKKGAWASALLALEVGDSLAVGGVKKSTAYAAAYRVGKAQTPKRKFTVRKEEVDGFEEAVRVWRMV